MKNWISNPKLPNAQPYIIMVKKKEKSNLYVFKGKRLFYHFF